MSPNARECTVVTNGDNELAAYIDRQKVFSSTGMNLNMPAPSEYYIETQSNLTPLPSLYRGMFVGIFTDYYATTSSSIKVINVPANFVVGVVNATSGHTLASAEADSTGVAFLDAGKYYIPIDAGVMMFDGPGGNLLASSTIHASIYGGDVVTVGSPGSEATTITVN